MKTRFLLVLAACLTACTTGPYRNTQLTSTSAPVRFQGFAAGPGTTITLAARNHKTGEYRTFATTTATSRAEVDSRGRSWYHWSTSVVLPRQGGYWQPDGTRSSKVTIRVTVGTLDAYSFTQAQMFCTVRNLSRGYADAALGCGATDAPLVLEAPCDTWAGYADAEMGGCYHAGRATSLRDFPFDRSYGLSNGMQGVCHDDNHWFFTTAWRNIWGQHSRIAKKSVALNLNDEDNFLVYGSAYASQGWRHPGDCDVFDGIVYVPLEPDAGIAPYNAIGRFNTADLAYHPALPLPANSPQRSPGNFPWMARNPRNGLWYSSRFDATELYVYEISGSTVTYRGAVRLPQALSRVQGGEFSPSGRLFLSTDWGTGLVSLEVPEGTGSSAAITQYSVLDWVPGDEEIEGLTVWDLDDGRSPGIGGQVHVLMIDTETFSTDDLYFKHVRITPLSAL